MPNLPISGLPAGGAVTAADPFPTDQAGVTVQVPASALATYALAQLGAAHPGYVSGRYYSSSPRIAAGANLSVAAATIYYTPLMIFKAVTIDAFGMRNGSANATAANANMAIYAGTAAGAPGAKLFDVATGIVIPGTANTGVIPTIGGGPQLMPIGCYWIAIQYDNTPQVLAAALENSMMGWIGGSTNVPSGFFAASAQIPGFSQALAYASGLPANATPVAYGAGNEPTAVFRPA